MSNSTVALPRYDDLFSVTLKAIQEMGGSGSVDAINARVAGAIRATPRQLSVVYEKNSVPILTDRMHWARNSLKTSGFIVATGKEGWALTQDGTSVIDMPQQELKKLILNEKRRQSGAGGKEAEQLQEQKSRTSANLGDAWERDLLSRLQV